MISIECHRSGERCPGKREFNNRIEINRVRSGEIDVAIPFKLYHIMEKPYHRKYSLRLVIYRYVGISSSYCGKINDMINKLYDMINKLLMILLINKLLMPMI